VGSAETSRARALHSGPRRHASGAPPAGEALAKLSLPDNLAPTAFLQSGSQKRAYVSEMGWLRGDEDVLKMVRQPLPAVPGPLARAVSACGEAISGVAKVRGAIRTETTAASLERRRKTVRTVPVEVRLTYSGWPSSEVRQARVACLLHGSGQVVGLAPLEQTVPLSEFSTAHAAGAPPRNPDGARAGQAAAFGER
jgi:hypothetical protein